MDDQEVVNAIYKYGSQDRAAAALGIPRDKFREECKRVRGKGRANLFEISGTSVLYDAEGNVKLEWVKTKKGSENEILLAAAEALKGEIPKEKISQKPEHTNEDLLSCYVITDYHFGQLSWEPETGDDWDAEIAEDLLVKWFAAAIESAPSSGVGLLAQLGDFLHWDGLEPLTPTSKHVLDADTRFSKLVTMVIRVLRRVINMMLEKHSHVHIIMAEGNHDIASSVWLRALFADKYSEDPRVTVDTTPHPYYAYEHGLTSLFFHHGHKQKLKKISNSFAGLYREIFGRTKYSYAHMGHMHHLESKEDSLMVVEQHPTLAAKDAHSARGGYVSQRGASVITYSKRSGEVSRSTIRPEMLK